MVSDRLVDRAPYLDDGEATREQRLRLVAHEIAHALRSGPFGVIVVRREDGLANELLFAFAFVTRTKRVIENHHAPGARAPFDERLHLRVIHGLQLFGIEERLDRGLVLDKDEAVAFERQRSRSTVFDRHRVQHRPCRCAAPDVVRTECFVDERFAGVDCVGNRSSNHSCQFSSSEVRAASTCDTAEQTLKILALGESECNRVIGGRMKPFLDARVDLRVERGAGDDLLKKLGRDPARARVGHEYVRPDATS